MSFYTSLVSGVLFPLHERLKHHRSTGVRRSLERSQWWDRDRLDALRLARLRGLLRQAGAHVPYYRELFRALGFSAADVRTLADLARLPFLSKADIRADIERLKSEHARHLVRSNTGGSSGEPMAFFLGRDRVSHDVAAKWRATRWWSVDIGDPEIVVWGSPIELGAQDRLRGWRDALMRTELLPAFKMSEADLDDFVARIRRRRPKMLFGYPSALAHIARHAELRGVAMNDLGIRVAFVTAERLHDEQRRQIEATFGCCVANGYGGRDAGFIAHQCPSGGMHITAEDIVLEIVDKDGTPLPPGSTGEVVVTHLASGDFPFIRYRTGDIAVVDTSHCACGRGLPLLKEIQGRTTDFVIASDGTLMHGLALVYVIRDMPGVAAFKIIQESRTQTRVLVVPAEGFTNASVVAIQRGFRARLGETVEIAVDRVAEIPSERSGKFRYVVSHAVAA